MSGFLTFYVSLEYRIRNAVLTTALSDCKANDAATSNQDVHWPRRMGCHYDAIRDTAYNICFTIACEIEDLKPDGI